MSNVSAIAAWLFLKGVHLFFRIRRPLVTDVIDKGESVAPFSVDHENYERCHNGKLDGRDAVGPNVECVVGAQDARRETQRRDRRCVFRGSQKIGYVHDAVTEDAEHRHPNRVGVIQKEHDSGDRPDDHERRDEWSERVHTKACEKKEDRAQVHRRH